MTAKSMGSLLMSALLIGGLLVPGHAPAATVNQLAPDFTLPSTTGDTISLSQFRGKKMVLLEFYGMNFGHHVHEKFDRQDGRLRGVQGSRH